jgi:RNA polymerase sigma factor (sigma-70 family)
MSVTGDDVGEPQLDSCRWERVWAHHDRLLRYARRHTSSEYDAEDVVAEALLRAIEAPEVDDARLPGWLTTVTARLCTDLVRERVRERRRWVRAGLPAGTRSGEDSVCERAEAAWVADRVAELPRRQRDALWLRADGLDLSGVARCLGVSYRSAESLLARARSAARAALASTLAPLTAVFAWRAGRWAGGVGAAAVSVAAVMTLSTVVTPSPPANGDGSTAPRPTHATRARKPVHTSRPLQFSASRPTWSDAPSGPPRAARGTTTHGGGARDAELAPTGLPASTDRLAAVPSLTRAVSAPTAPRTHPVAAPSAGAPVAENPLPDRAAATKSAPHVTSPAVSTDPNDGRPPQLRNTG